MLFSSIFFINVFLPLTFLFYQLSNKTVRNFVLLVASLLFYAWGEPSYLVVMLINIVLTYFSAMLLQQIVIKQVRLLCLIISLIINFSSLFYFKYFNFVCDNINSLFGGNFNFSNIVMPIGISFYTFQSVSYLIDVYRKEVFAQKNFYNLALYISLFPQLVAGPIVKYHDINNQIDERVNSFNNIICGFKRFIIGLGKKVLIANPMGEIADKIFEQSPDAYPWYIAWIGALSYTMQIFFDFSGYSDMAIGLGRVFGFKFKENFNYPYISTSITEFWRRWHISLSTWFKEYLYIPLGGNRNGNIRTYINLSIVFLATGIWHGAAWNFVLWGIWNGFFIVLEKIIGVKKFIGNNFYSKFLLHFYCSLIFILGWVLFRSKDVEFAGKYFFNMFGLQKCKQSLYDILYYVDIIPIVVFIVACLCSTPIFKHIFFYFVRNVFFRFLVNIYLLLIFVLSIIVLSSNSYNPFIYFRF